MDVGVRQLQTAAAQTPLQIFPLQDGNIHKLDKKFLVKYAQMIWENQEKESQLKFYWKDVFDEDCGISRWVQDSSHPCFVTWSAC